MSIVQFNNWCKKCKYYDTPETKDPCNDCLNVGYNDNSTKPIYWVEKKSGNEVTKNQKALREKKY